MTEQRGLGVAGYRPTQSQENIDAVNELKFAEERALRLLDDLGNRGREGRYDSRWLAIARTHIQQGFMAASRAVFQPTRVQLPEDAA